MYVDFYGLDRIGGWTSTKVMRQMLMEIRKSVFTDQGMYQVIPCEHLEDPGVSGIFLADSCHFTCHTFSNRDAAFADLYCTKFDKAINQKVSSIIRKYYACERLVYNVADVIESEGKYGKHLVFSCDPVSLIEAVNLMKRVLNFLDMKMLCPLNVDARSNDDYDILQAITESHIAFHTNKQKMDVDIFSCRSFSSTVLDLFRNVYNIQTIQRGWLLGRNGVYGK